MKLSLEELKKYDLNDPVYVINHMMNNIKDGDSIVLEQATYDLKTTFAMNQFCYISNNDSGLKHLAFYMENKKNITIDGGGSFLHCVGRILPFYFKNCENILLKNFVIDYERAFMSQGEVIAATETTADLKIDEAEFPYEIKNGTMRFYGEDYYSDSVHGLLEYEKESKRPIGTAWDTSIKGGLVAEKLDNGLVRLHCKFTRIPTIGAIMTIKHEERYVPTITIDACKNVKLEHIWIKQSGAMAVIVQLSSDIHLDGVNVYADETSQRVFSANADATHFVNCYGKVIVENGRFESMLDDVINVHGNYLRVEQVFNEKEILVAIPHFQQEGFMNFYQGSNIAICEQQTMFTHGNSKIKSVTKVNQKHYRLELETPYDFKSDLVYCIDNIDLYPEVLFRKNDCGRNRARGLILTSTKEMIVEENCIDSEGSAIKVNSDMKNWYESAAISHLIIRNNKLTRKNHENWGVALIDIDPGMKKQVEGEFFHGSVTIENNDILLEKSPLFFGYSFDTAIIRNNTVTLKNGLDWNSMVQTENCGTVLVEENEIISS